MVRSRDSLAANMARPPCPRGGLQGVPGGFLRHRLALPLGKLSLVPSRTLGFGGGTALPGRLAEAIDPSRQRWLTQSLTDGCILITGANGHDHSSSPFHVVAGLG